MPPAGKLLNKGDSTEPSDDVGWNCDLSLTSEQMVGLKETGGRGEWKEQEGQVYFTCGFVY